MASKVAYIKEFDVDAGGNVIDRNSPSTTIKQMLTANKSWRVVEDATNPNTNGYPTIEEYLDLEKTSGRTFRGMIGAYMMVTQN